MVLQSCSFIGTNSPHMLMIFTSPVLPRGIFCLLISGLLKAKQLFAPRFIQLSTAAAYISMDNTMFGGTDTERMALVYRYLLTLMISI